MMEKDPRRAALAAIRRGLDLGVSHVDTAETYGNGAAERIVAEAIEGRRDEVFLVSKVLPTNASRGRTKQACERSLARLRTDRLDCYLLHWRGAPPLEETLGAFVELEREGKILSFGVSNFDVEDLEEATAIVGPGRIACDQVLYHLGVRSIEHDVIPWCEQHGVAVVAYSPFGHAGGFPDPTSTGGRVLAEVAAAYDATPRQVALAYLARLPSTFVIPKAADAGHMAENARAGTLHLGEVDIERISAAFPRQDRSSLPML